MSERPRAVIVVTGSELVRGDRRDENGPYLAAQLLRLGADPARIVIVGDQPDELEAAVREALEADICVLSGGLGPTHDDRTVEILARAAGRALHVDPDLEREIGGISREYAARLGRSFTDFAPGVTKQARLPDGALSLGLAGTAPGVLLELGEHVAIALPGPPLELRRLWAQASQAQALRRILDRGRPRGHAVLRFFGPSESSVAKAIEDGGGETPGVEVTVCARDFEIHVDLFAEAEAAERREEIEASLRARFAEELFAEDDRPVEELVLGLCRARGLTLVTAESCTGGLVGARLTAVPGSSESYLGGVVAYSNAVKVSQLGVPAETLTRHGAVSAQAAEAMAAGARASLRGDVGASVTGVAGPGGGTPDKPVGLVFLHAQGPDGDDAVRFELPGDRERIRDRATASLLHLLRRTLARSGQSSV